MSAANRLIIDDANFFKEAVADRGLTVGELEGLEPRLENLRARLRQGRDRGDPAFFGLPFQAEHLEEARRWGERITTGYEQLVVLGMGGSSLGGEMLIHCLGGSEPPVEVRFLDNVDPERMEATLAGVHWSRACVLAVSKSGGTAETLAQLLTILPRLERAVGRPRVRDHLIALTENPDGALGRIADDIGAPIVRHPAVGGRYSVLSPVGLIPGFAAGADVEGVVAGARAMAERCLAEGIVDNPAFRGGVAQYLLAERGMTQSVQLPYYERLDKVTSWYRQLWAESLGKLDAAGAHRGLTPVRAMGATDQHSQLQLYLQGPGDKQFTLFFADDLEHGGGRIPEGYAHLDAVAPLAGHTVGELLSAEFQATRETLARNGRPSRTLRFPALDATALGELIMLLETETVVVAELLGVDPFDQPAVEESKVLTREYLARMVR